MKKVMEDGVMKRAEIDADKVADNLYRCGWKLQGVAGLMFQDSEESVILDADHWRGLSFLLEQIADDIQANTEIIERMAKQGLKAGCENV